MTRRELQRQKFKMISDFQGSGKTQLAFVREAGISLTGFRYWLKKYRAKHEKPAGNGFVEVVPSGATSAEACFDIIFPNGVRANMPSAVDGALLGKVIKSW
jgi:hypothetical protein